MNFLKVIFEIVNTFRVMSFAYWFNKFLSYKLDSLFLSLQIVWCFIFFFLPSYFTKHYFFQVLLISLFFLYVYNYYFHRFFFLRLYLSLQKSMVLSFYSRFFFGFLMLFSLFSLCLFVGFDIFNTYFCSFFSFLIIFLLLINSFFFSYRFFLFVRFFVFSFLRRFNRFSLATDYFYVVYFLFFFLVYISMCFLIIYYLVVCLNVFDSSVERLGYIHLFDWFTIPVDRFYFSFFLNEDLLIRGKNPDLLYFSNYILRFFQDLSVCMQHNYDESSDDCVS